MLGIAETRAHAGPPSPEARADLWHVYATLTDVSMHADDPESARTYARNGVAAAAVLAAADPSGAEAKRQLWRAHGNLGVSCFKLEDFDGAKSAFQDMAPAWRSTGIGLTPVRRRSGTCG